MYTHTIISDKMFIKTKANAKKPKYQKE